MGFAFMLAAPQSGSGKTTLTLALLRAFRRQGLDVGSAKAGPDYIDPAFHAMAGSRPCLNLDPWAMGAGRLRDLSAHAMGGDGLVVEAMMGLFDGAADGTGSSGDLAAHLGLPVILVVDCTRQSHSIAALVCGFARYREDVRVAGIVLNRVASLRHETMLRDALAEEGWPVVGAVPRSPALELPARHLGLVQAQEHAAFDAFADRAAEVVEEHLDLEALMALRAGPQGPGATEMPLPPLPPLGQRIAIAKDAAFSFIYPHLVEGWRAQGASVCFFSPLANAGPPEDADAIFLPGGYPELHGGHIAQNSTFLEGLKSAAQRGCWIYGECGGYMVLGEALIDAQGARHTMSGLLPVVTSFETRKRHLGYRRARACVATPFGEAGHSFMAHEFHYTAMVEDGPGQQLFEACDARGEALGRMGHINGRVFGSYLHLIDRAL